ncbi:MAG: MmgE/PrpD family protein [Boseongicola sp.]|nr:MmgE/PrpD family protein [Boseongicola sp.]
MISDDLAEFVLGAPDVPEGALDFTATLLVDTLGVTAGSARLDAARITRDHAVRFHAAGTPDEAATLLFDGRKASIPGAAFAAATQTDNLDAHDGLNPTKGHIGCAVVPALCALAEREPALSGRDALTALAISYEVAARAALSLHATVSDYHTSGAWNALGVAALGARLRNLDAGRLRHALGIAEYHGPRSQMMREIANPTMLHDGSGMGAFVGLMAVLLAEEGFEGAPAATVEADEVAERWGDLGRRWTVEQNYVKPYPICRWAHAAIDALGQLMEEHGFAAHDVSAIDVNTFAEAAQLFSGMPETTSHAQYSLAFALAALLVHGKIGPDQVNGKALSDPDIEAVVNRIRVSEDPRHSARFPDGRWSDVTVHLSDGRTMSSGDVNAKGGPEAPLPHAAVEAKFLDMTRRLDRGRATAIWEMRDRLTEPGTKFADLLRLLHARPDS